VFRVALPVKEPVRHQHEGHQWMHVLDGRVRLLIDVATADS
jgi:hypothetical protein